LKKYIEECIKSIKKLINEQLKNKSLYKKIGWVALAVSLTCIVLVVLYSGLPKLLDNDNSRYINAFFALAAISLRLVLIQMSFKAAKSILFYENSVAKIESLLVGDLKYVRNILDKIMNSITGKR